MTKYVKVLYVDEDIKDDYYFATNLNSPSKNKFSFHLTQKFLLFQIATLQHTSDIMSFDLKCVFSSFLKNAKSGIQQTVPVVIYVHNITIT